MTSAQIEEAAIKSQASSEDELADEIYEMIRAAIEQGEPREEALAHLKAAYARLLDPHFEIQRRAVREVIGCFYGYCAPEVAL